MLTKQVASQVVRRLVIFNSRASSGGPAIVAKSGIPAGDYPDPFEHATGKEKMQLLAKLAGDDRYEPKIYERGPGTLAEPNEVPSAYDCRIIGCVCEPDQHWINWMWLHKGTSKRCDCGHFFKLIDDN